MDDGNRVLCFCSHRCAGGNVVCLKTAKRHSKEAHQLNVGNNTARSSEAPSPLHAHTDMTLYMLKTMVIQLYNNHAGVTQQCITQILLLLTASLGSLVPSHHIPKSFRELQRCLEDYLVPVDIWTACPGECQLWSGKRHGCTKQKCAQGVTKTYQYLPMVPRLRQMFAIPSLAKQLKSHMDVQTNGHAVSDIHQSVKWKQLYGPGGSFEGNPRAIALEYSADGFAPFHHSTSKQYSVEHQGSIILNLPPLTRSEPGFGLLHGLIPGPSAPKQECYNIYMKPFVDEVKMIENEDIMLFDADADEEFKLQVMIMLQCHDFPGQAKVFHGHGSASVQNACPMCRIQAVYSKVLHKPVFGNGRKFLAVEDPLREDTSFPGGNEERSQPMMRDYERETLATAVNGAMTAYAEATPSRSTERRWAKSVIEVAAAMGARKRCSEFDRLGNTEASKIVVEGMHTVQRVIYNYHGLLNGHADSKNVRDHEESLERFPGCYADDRGKFGDAPFTLRREDKTIADARMRNICIPAGKGTIPKEMFANFHSMKSHTWHIVLLKGVYLFTLRGMLGATQRQSMVKFCFVMSICAARTIHMDLMPRFEKVFQHCLSLMDRDYPETLKTILWHMLRHFPKFVKSYGPLHSYWMFFFERQIHHHVSRMHSSRHPEASMTNAYRIDFMCTLVRQAESVQTGSAQISPPTEKGSLPHNCINHLKTSYLQTYPQLAKTYQHLCREGRAAQPGHSLTADEKAVVELEAPSDNITKWFSDRRGSMTWKAFEKWGRKGSVVFQRDVITGCVCFGYIMYFFRHTFLGKDHTFASIGWFAAPTIDEECQLFVCKPHTPHPYMNPFLHLEDLSEPLIVAHEGDDSLYVLDFMDKQRTIELIEWIEETSMRG